MGVDKWTCKVFEMLYTDNPLSRSLFDWQTAVDFLSAIPILLLLVPGGQSL
jgi:hypothetical protein